MELGSGLGFTGLTVVHACRPDSYTFTDCHPRPLQILAENVNTNHRAALSSHCTESPGCSHCAIHAEGGNKRVTATAETKMEPSGSQNAMQNFSENSSEHCTSGRHRLENFNSEEFDLNCEHCSCEVVDNVVWDNADSSYDHDDRTSASQPQNCSTQTDKCSASVRHGSHQQTVDGCSDFSLPDVIWCSSEVVGPAECGIQRWQHRAVPSLNLARLDWETVGKETLKTLAGKTDVIIAAGEIISL